MQTIYFAGSRVASASHCIFKSHSSAYRLASTRLRHIFAALHVTMRRSSESDGKMLSLMTVLLSW